jgi:hypothetical protein
MLKGVKTCYFHNLRGDYNKMYKSKYCFLPYKYRKEIVQVNAVFMFQCTLVPEMWLTIIVIPFRMFWMLFLSDTFSVVFKEPVYSSSKVQLFMWHTLKYLHKVIKTVF